MRSTPRLLRGLSSRARLDAVRRFEPFIVANAHSAPFRSVSFEPQFDAFDISTIQHSLDFIFPKAKIIEMRQKRNQ
jgi:hypothetical protein